MFKIILKSAIKKYLLFFYHQIPILIFISIIVTAIIVLLEHTQKVPKENIIKRLFLSASLAIIFTITLSGRSRELSGQSFVFKPFWSYIEAYKLNDVKYILGNVLNIILFVPFGIALPMNFDFFKKLKLTVGFALLISLTIELIQGLTKIGIFEFDDIVHNFIGAALGFLFYLKIIKRCKKTSLK